MVSETGQGALCFIKKAGEVIRYSDVKEKKWQHFFVDSEKKLLLMFAGKKN